MFRVNFLPEDEPHRVSIVLREVRIENDCIAGTDARGDLVLELVDPGSRVVVESTPHA